MKRSRTVGNLITRLRRLVSGFRYDVRVAVDRSPVKGQLLYMPLGYEVRSQDLNKHSIYTVASFISLYTLQGPVLRFSLSSIRSINMKLISFLLARMVYLHLYLLSPFEVPRVFNTSTFK